MTICNYSAGAADRLRTRISENELGTPEMHRAEQAIGRTESSLNHQSSTASSVANQAKKSADYCANCLRELDRIRDTIMRKIKSTPTSTVVTTRSKDADGNIVTKKEKIPINSEVIENLKMRLQFCDALEGKITMALNGCSALAAEAGGLALDLNSAAREVGRLHSQALNMINRFGSSLYDVREALNRAENAAMSCLSVPMRSNWETEEFIPPVPLK